MAIADILTRIEDDAKAEADAILAAARERAEAVESRARSAAEHEAARLKTKADIDARSEAATLLANARLAARDALLGAKKDLADRVLDGVRERVEALPDAEYAAFIADGIAAVALSGQRVRVAAADRQRLASLGSLLAARGIELILTDEVADLPRGAYVEGDRVRVEVSAAATIADRHAELLPVVVAGLFGEQEA